MVVLFATVVFAGSFLNGTRDRVGHLFAKSIKTEQDSASNTSAISADSNGKTTESSSTTSNFSEQPKKTTPPQIRGFRVELKHADTLDRKPFNGDFKQTDGNKELLETNQEERKTIASADHGVQDEDRDKIKKSGNTAEQDEDENSGSDERKLNTLPNQGCTFQRSPIRQRRKGPKTLKKELEEAGILISENGRTDIKSEQKQQQANNSNRGEGVNRDMQHGDQYIGFALEVNNGSDNSSGSQDDFSLTGDDTTINKPRNADDFIEVARCFPIKDIISPDVGASNNPMVIERKVERISSRITEEKSEGCSTCVLSEEIEVASGGASNNTGADSRDVDSDEAHILHDDGRSHFDDLSSAERKDALPVDAGDTVKKQTKFENQRSGQGTISETGDFGQPHGCDHEGPSAADVDPGRMTRVRHRSQKAVEDRCRILLPEKDGAIKESVLKRDIHLPKGKYDDDTQQSAILHIQPTQINSVTHESNASINRKSTTSSRNHRVFTRALASEDSPVGLADALDLVAERFNDSVVGQDAEQTSSQNDELSDMSDEDDEQQSGDEFDSHEITRQDVPNTFPSYDDIVVKRELLRFLEDFGAFDRVHAYWNHEHYEDENIRSSNRENNIIAMAVENRGRQPKKMERLHLKDRITLATCHLGTITMEIKKEEDRLLKLVQELGDARLESEKSKRELLKEEKLYRQLLDYSKAQEDTKALDARSRAVEIELLVLRRRKWKTDMMLDAATAEVSLLDHRLKKEQTLQEEQKERRLGSKRRRFQQTTIKVNALSAFIILQIILLVIALWHL